MPNNFADIVEEIKTLSLENKIELRYLLDKYLGEARREEIFTNYQDSLQEFRENKLEFSPDINQIRGILNR